MAHAGEAVSPADAGGERFLVSGLDLGAVRSLFVGFAATSLGRRAIGELAPRDDDGARAALERVRDVQTLEKAGDPPSLGGVADVRPALEAARGFRRPFEAAELASLVAFLESAMRLAEWLRDRAADVPALAALSVGFPGLTALRSELVQTVDGKGELKDSASPRLGRLRDERRDLDGRISAVVERIAGKPDLRTSLTDGRVHLRGGRRVLAVKAGSARRVPGLSHGRSQSGETIYVEPQEAVELGNRLTELDAKVRDEERRVLVEVTRTVLEREESIDEASARIAELEMAVVGAAACAALGARVPALVAPSEGLVLRAARHPLLVRQHADGELDEVVPIDVRLGGDFDLLVVTGPNTGGKTLAVKTVGVAAFCARMGWPVCCAEGSRVPLYDGIVADIGDEQEIRQSLSTFASHLVRVRDGVERASAQTLVLLDELGGGTDPDEGAALGDAILEHLLERGVPTMATTHLGKLKEFCFRHQRAENASVEFDPATLRPRYRLLIGTPGESNALAIARRLGLDASICERAAERLERRDKETLELMAQVRGAREHAERVRSAAESKLAELERSHVGVQEKEAELDRRGELLEAEAQRGLEERVREARRDLERAMALVDQIPGETARPLRDALAAVDAGLTGASLTERRKAFLGGLGKGELVYIPRYKQRCLVHKVDRSKGEVTVKLGNMKMRVPFDEVTWYEAL